MQRAKQKTIIPQDVKKDLRRLSRLWKKEEEAKALLVRLHDENHVPFSLLGRHIGQTKQGARAIYLSARGGGLHA